MSRIRFEIMHGVNLNALGRRCLSSNLHQSLNLTVPMLRHLLLCTTFTVLVTVTSQAQDLATPTPSAKTGLRDDSEGPLGIKELTQPIQDSPRGYGQGPANRTPGMREQSSAGS